MSDFMIDIVNEVEDEENEESIIEVYEEEVQKNENDQQHEIQEKHKSIIKPLNKSVILERDMDENSPSLIRPPKNTNIRKISPTYCLCKRVNENQRPRGSTPWGGKWSKKAMPFVASKRKKRTNITRKSNKVAWTPTPPEENHSGSDKDDKEAEAITKNDDDDVSKENVDSPPLVYEEEDSAEFDTDVETEFQKKDKRRNAKDVYEEVCRIFRVSVIPEFIQNMNGDRLELPYRNMGPNSFKALSVPLASNNSIRLLDLTENALGPVGAYYLSIMIKHNTCLSDLSIANNSIGCLGLSCISNTMPANLTLQKLNLSNNKLTDNCAEDVAEILKNTARLKVLDLSHNEFSDIGLMTLSDGFKYNTSIEELDLSWNHFGSKGFNFLTKNLQSHPRIVSIKTQFTGVDNNISDSIRKLISNKKGGSNTLKRIDLANCRINDKIAEKLAVSLLESKVATEINLSYNGIIHEETVIKLAEALKKNKDSNIETLNIQGLVLKEPGEAALKALREDRESNNLKAVDIIHSGIAKLDKELNLSNFDDQPISGKKATRFRDVLGRNISRSKSLLSNRSRIRSVMVTKKVQNSPSSTDINNNILPNIQESQKITNNFNMVVDKKGITPQTSKTDVNLKEGKKGSKKQLSKQKETASTTAPITTEKSMDGGGGGEEKDKKQRKGNKSKSGGDKKKENSIKKESKVKKSDRKSFTAARNSKDSKNILVDKKQDENNILKENNVGGEVDANITQDKNINEDDKRKSSIFSDRDTTVGNIDGNVLEETLDS